MVGFFDALTVACFIGLVGVFFRFTERDGPALLRCVLSGIVLAIANQLGNADYVVLGLALVAAAVGYPWLFVSKRGGDL
jgi:hypothetical protein